MENLDSLLVMLDRIHRVRHLGPTVRIVTGGKTEEVVLLSEQKEIVIGREASCHVILSDESCSRKHAVLVGVRSKEGGWAVLLTDVGSSCG